MRLLTPAERRGAVTLVLLLAVGVGHDLWRGSRPVPPESRVTAPGRDASRGDSVVRAAPAPEAAGGTGPPVDVNRATAEELDTLPGIGPVLAARIVAHRVRHGPFRSPEELLAVRGIGPRLYERLRDRVVVAPPPAR